MAIIITDKKRLLPDPFIRPVHGDWGPCTLCGNYSKLTEAHVPPQSVGNTVEWNGRSYLTAMSGQKEDLYFGRRFRGGFRLKTLCRDCNSSLGGREDKALADFFSGVRKLVETPLIIGTTAVSVTAKPNLIFRGLFAHLASANDDGRPCAFDLEARNIFFGKRSLRQSSWSLFYWPYLGEQLVVMRNVFHVTWSPTVEVLPMFILKLRPLAFLFTPSPWFMGLPNMRRFFCNRDDDETELPVPIFAEDSAVWPATTSSRNIIMAGGNTFGIVGSRRS